MGQTTCVDSIQPFDYKYFHVDTAYQVIGHVPSRKITKACIKCGAVYTCLISIQSRKGAFPNPGPSE